MWKKVVWPTALVGVLWIAVGGATTFYMDWLYQEHVTVLSENVATIRAAASMYDVLWRLQVLAADATNSNPEGRSREVRFAELEQTFQQSLETAERTATTPKEQVAVQAIQEQFSLYREHLHQQLAAHNEKPASSISPHAETVVLARAVAQPCRTLIDLNDELLTESVTKSSRQIYLVNVIRFLFLVAGPAIGIACGLWVARGLHRTVSQISVTLTDATDELGVVKEVGRVSLSPSGDLPSLQHQVQSVSAQIRQVVGELQEARRETRRADRLAAVGQLAAGVAHELRNPLTSVKLLVQAATQRPVDRTLGEKQLQIVQQEVGRMEKTIQALLDFARPPRLHQVRHNVVDTVRRALNLVEGRARQQHVTFIEHSIEPTLEVDADPEQLHQVFVNVLLNGIDAMPEGGDLEVTMRRCPQCSKRCEIIIADSGQGISAEIMDHVFEPFVSGKELGTGLGLAISRRIVEEHGGTITAANRAERGAIFTLTVPLGSDDASHEQATPNTAAFGNALRGDTT